MVRINSILASGVALVVATLSSVHAADDQALPWDGRFQDLTVDTLTDEYLTHILTNRQNGTVSPDQWVTVTKDGRSPAYNDDTGVATLAVDSEAIFGGQTNFRRSELVQDVAGNTAGTTFFRVSLMKEKAYVNLYSWQVIFPESHLFEVRIDASVDPPMLIWYTGGSTETRWAQEFKTSTWYNFGIAVSSGELALYFSEGDDALALTKTESYDSSVPTDYEFHFGQLTLSDDGSAVEMVAGEQDVLSFNGVSVEDSIPSGTGSTAANSSTKTTSSTGSSTTSTTTTAPTATTATPTATTAAPTATTAAPTATTAAPSTTTTAPSTTEESAASDADEATDDSASASTTTTTTTTTAPSTATTDAPTTESTACKVRRRRN